MEAEKIPIAISLSSDVCEVLDENDVDLIAAISREGIEVHRSDDYIIVSDGKGYKSPELIIMASGGAALLVSAAIVRVVDSITRGRKATVTQSDVEAAKIIRGGDTHSINIKILGFSISIDDKYGLTDGTV